MAREARRVTVLTGAGMSAESGVPTFRDAQTGLWARYDPMTLATPEAFETDPELVWAWYAWRRRLMQQVQPNAGHRALAEWGRRDGVQVRIATQNVDDLHERAGSEVLAHLHGSLFELRCFDCDRRYTGAVEIPDEQVERLEPPVCGACAGPVRPGIVWFGELLPQRDLARAEQAATEADLVLVVGSSGLVHPAAGLPLQALAAGVPTIEVNPAESAFSPYADFAWRTTAGTGLPALVAALD
nr:NAD-dependent deacylase [Naumannella cuiyingiana]